MPLGQSIQMNTSKNIPLVGLVGFPGTGKDSIARVLVEDHGWLRMAFADALKEDMVEIDPDVNSVEHLDVLKRSDEYWRVRLQLFGEYVRKIEPDYWVRRAKNKETVEKLTSETKAKGIIYTDIRYPNEAEMICERGGYLIGIHRTGYDMVNNHISERNTQDILDGCAEHFSNNTVPEDVAQAILAYTDSPF